MTTKTKSAAAQATQQFTPLELETRPTVDTAAYAHYMHIAEQTARFHACKESGPIRPIRIPGTAKLHWPVAEIRRVLGVAPLQKGFINLSNLAGIIGVCLLLPVVLMAWPGIFASLDWTDFALLGAGVIGTPDSRQNFNLSELTAAGSVQYCSVDMHLNTQGKPVFTVGNSNTGAAEFSGYFDALEYISARTTYTVCDVAEQAGNATQTERGAILLETLQYLVKLHHHDRAAAGFALALGNVLEIGLQNLPQVQA